MRTFASLLLIYSSENIVGQFCLFKEIILSLTDKLPKCRALPQPQHLSSATSLYCTEIECYWKFLYRYTLHCIFQIKYSDMIVQDQQMYLIVINRLNSCFNHTRSITKPYVCFALTPLTNRTRVQLAQFEIDLIPA